MTKKTMWLVLALTACIRSYADNFMVGGFCYEIQKDDTARVSLAVCNPLNDIVDIPSHVTFQSKQYEVVSIDKWAFADCQHMTQVTIPATCRTIAAGTFLNCRKLQCIRVSAANQWYCDVDGVLYDKSCTTLLRFPPDNPAAEYGVKPTTRRIAAYAFFGCQRLTAIRLPLSLHAIGQAAFMNCNHLADIALPADLRQIDDYAFWGCRQIKESCMGHLHACQTGSHVFYGQ